MNPIRWNSLSNNWQRFIVTCQKAPYSKISGIQFQKGQPLTFTDIQASYLMKEALAEKHHSLKDYELKTQWVNFIRFVQTQEDFTLDLLVVQNGLPEKVDLRLPHLKQSFNQMP